MKKSIIAAGAASVALAAMPVVGAFAAFTGGPFTDVIQTTIGETCTFARGATAHGAGETWTTDTTVTTKDTLSAVTITPAAGEATLGTSNFRVVCNDTDGYKVTVGTNPLALPTGTTQVHTWAYNAGAAPSSPTASYWRIGSTGDGVDLSNNIVSTKASAEDGKDFTVTYYAYAITGQDAGTYSAEVTYTAAQLP